LNDDDEVVTVLPIRDTKDNLAIFTSQGYGKQILISDLLMQKRGGKGLICYKTNDLNGYISCASLVNNDDMVLVCGNTNSICINASDIPVQTRTAAGNIIIKNNNILSVSKV
jgi:DNA gyrase subunit A